MKKLSLDKSLIKILLLEGIHQSASHFFNHNNYFNIETISSALEGPELIDKIRDAHIVGIRSRTMLNEVVLKEAKKLFAVGCFSIGTNQVDLNAAKMLGIPVFNAPFSNTRSVAELVIGECIMLMRGIPVKNTRAHEGYFLKTAAEAHEIRGKNLGIIGYGHIGSQVSILAEMLGMNVCYYDIVKKLSLGNATPCESLKELLTISDFVTLHVPATPRTKNMISHAELSQIKKGAILINASRGDVVNLDAVASAVKSGHLKGAGIDVFPDEPASNNEHFSSLLQGFDNVILTPHIAGSTVEAQENIGIEVAEKLVHYSDTGSTMGAVNFVQIALQANLDKQRFLHIHHNQPGLLKSIDNVFTSRQINIAAQFLQTDQDVGYVIIDTDSQLDESIIDELKEIPGTIRTRMLY